MDDNTIHAVKVWEAGQGTFFPVSKHYYGYACNISVERLELIRNRILDESNIMVCVNDNENLNEEEFCFLKRELLTILDNKFPAKSEFEI